VLLHTAVGKDRSQSVKVIPIFVPLCIAPKGLITRENFQVIASVFLFELLSIAVNNGAAVVTILQGSFGCASRITSDRGVFVIKVLDITERSYKWVMREILFGYHLSQFDHPNIARLMHHYVSPNSVPQNHDFAARSCIFFVQDDCGQSLIQ